MGGTGSWRNASERPTDQDRIEAGEERAMQPSRGMEGTLAELADPGFAIDPQWIVGADLAAENPGPANARAAEIANDPQWIVWADVAEEERWADVELVHLCGTRPKGS
jgi:hypothetical protein